MLILLLASLVQAAPRFKTIRGPLHIVNKKQLMTKTRATACVVSKMAQTVHNRLPRCIIKAECKACDTLLCNPLFYHIFVRYTNKLNDEHILGKLFQHLLHLSTNYNKEIINEVKISMNISYIYMYMFKELIIY